MDTDKLLRPHEAKAILQCSSDTLARWAREGRIRYVKVGPTGMRRYRRADIEALLKPTEPVTGTWVSPSRNRLG